MQASQICYQHIVAIVVTNWNFQVIIIVRCFYSENPTPEV